jgi:hypothetical protein
MQKESQGLQAGKRAPEKQKKAYKLRYLRSGPGLGS